MPKKMKAIEAVEFYIDKRVSELERGYRALSPMESTFHIQAAHNMGQQKALLDLRLAIAGKTP